MPSLQPRSKLTPNTPNFSLDEENVEEKPSISETDPMISPTYLFDESCNTSNSSSLACTPSPPVTADVFADVYDAFMLPPVNETFLLLDNDTNMGIRCDSFQEDNLF
ncbi:hypothetical protein G6F56_008355 [Rhizopus delemar]|nr:hypothetical protein G6F56_008355 [Rhizopus delemar]